MGLSSSLFLSSNLFLFSCLGLFSSLLLSSSLVMFSILGLFSSRMLLSPSKCVINTLQEACSGPLGLSSALLLSSIEFSVPPSLGGLEQNN